MESSKPQRRRGAVAGQGSRQEHMCYDTAIGTHSMATQHHTARPTEARSWDCIAAWCFKQQRFSPSHRQAQHPSRINGCDLSFHTARTSGVKGIVDGRE
mmetsp:Transcript_4569/g.10728  ORF Transcript_4569/g.10728 Transcript_4569/m.10728 type:complete len:99 (+) Transcript_4569:1440-1736(+)